MSKFEGFIFDIDGTITSTNELIFATFNFVAEKYLNKKFSNEEIIALFGPTEDYILKEMMKDKYEEAKLDYYHFYDSKHEEMADIFPGIDDLLKLIKDKNYPIGIYTGKGRKSSEITLRKLGIFDYFDLIMTGDDVKEHKPSPEGINKFIEKFSLERNKVLMIGDAPADVIASKEAGVKCASVLWESYAKDEVVKMDSDYKFDTVDDLYNFIKTNI